MNTNISAVSKIAEQVGSISNDSDVYWGDAQLEFRPGHQTILSFSWISSAFPSK
jgi:hypothetical protein